MNAPNRPRGVVGFLRSHWSQLLALCCPVAITAVIVVYRRQLAALSTYGYLGVFLVSVLGNATVLFPVPSLAIVFAGGGVLNPVLVGLVAGVGEPLGELTGYLAGYSGRAVIENRERYERVSSWMQRRGFLTLLGLSAIPNPLFDVAGVSAGMLRFPVAKFLLACWLGKTVKALAIAYLGSVSLGWFSSWLQ